MTCPDINSTESYHKCIDEGLFPKRQKEILKLMALRRPGTASYYSRYVPGAWKHFASLLRAKVVVRVDRVQDSDTNRTVWLYDLASDFRERVQQPPLPAPRLSRASLLRQIKEAAGILGDLVLWSGLWHDHLPVTTPSPTCPRCRVEKLLKELNESGGLK